MKPHILIAVDDFNEAHLTKIRQAFEGQATWERIDQYAPEAVFRSTLNHSSIVIGWPDPAWLNQTPVQFHQLPSAGYDNYLNTGLEEKTDFTLCNARGVMSIPVAEHFLALMLALARRLPEHLNDKASKRWQRRQRYGEVSGSTICILGLGDIGSEIARRCLALGMKVIGVRQYPAKGHELVQEVYPVRQLKKAVGQANHVVVIFPAGPGMERSFDAGVFEAMKPGSFFFNLARGSIVDEGDLIENLQTGHLAGAGLDVFSQEPLLPESPLWSMNNVIITPHVGGRSVREFDRLCDLFVANLERFLLGKPLLNQVIPELSITQRIHHV
jgi:phosphoglycerate dehydrogenase-like enzyme